ncbi:MAG TPA: trypsin-like peptidase domain-containing protein [Planctomycetota bacterium]|jgi:serine protease Do|nr:trypsin-like peptidase domain-containing protein [Planctomycetota bacterium]HJM38646.1 trypsin-like peptidase domain-containing protein [Planctomycetota bacterium]|tara:strand:- start:24604 stop:25644 length:1041 start_codon:yes stop_codon:yes gene_type:complete
MSIPRTTLLFVFLAAILWIRPATTHFPKGPSALESLSEATAGLASDALMATVFLRVDQKEGSAGNGEQHGAGTGFVLDAMRGLVVTNNHVVGDSSSRMRVTLHDGRQFYGDPVATDPQTDIAVVRIPEGVARRQLRWGSSDKMVPGSWVMALGNPLGLTGTTSLGVVSGLNRELGLAKDSYEDFLQHDAFIDHGSSGGPLLNMRGEVVGVNTAIGGSLQRDAWQGISYAVPSRMARRVVADLIEHGKVRRGWLGVATSDLDFGDARNQGMEVPGGAIVTKLVEDSPAAVAGMKKGDIVLELDSMRIRSAAHLRARVGTVAPGSEAIFKIRRGRSTLEMVALIRERG